MKLEDWRKEIDGIDGEIITLLNRRAKAAHRNRKNQGKSRTSVIDLERESEVLRNIVSENEGILHDWQLATIYQKIWTNRDKFR